MDNIGLRLKEMIEEKGLTLLAFSEKAGIQRSSLSHLFSGRNKPSVDLLLKIKHQFPDTDLEWLITGERYQTVANADDQEDQAKKSASISDVTNVNIDNVSTDNQSIKGLESNQKKTNIADKEIERIILFYKNGEFKEYKNA